MVILNSKCVQAIKSYLFTCQIEMLLIVYTFNSLMTHHMAVVSHDSQHFNDRISGWYYIVHVRYTYAYIKTMETFIWLNQI